MNARGDCGRLRRVRPTGAVAYRWWRAPVAFPGAPSQWVWQNYRKSRIALSGLICRFAKRVAVGRRRRSKTRICCSIWKNYWNQ